MSTYILSPAAETYYQSSTPYSVGSSFTQTTKGYLRTGRYASASTNRSGIAALRIKIPDYLSLNKITSIKITGDPISGYTTDYVGMAWSENWYTVDKVVQNNTSYVGTLLVKGTTAQETNIRYTLVNEKPLFTINFKKYSDNIVLSNNYIYCYFYVYGCAHDTFNTNFRIENTKITIETSEPITKLDAPLFLSENYISKPDASIQVQWQKVDNVDLNKVKNYRVYFKRNQSPTTEDYEGYIDTTSLTHTFPASSFERGEQVYIRLQAISTHTGSSIEYLKDSDSPLSDSLIVTINSLPTIPSFLAYGNKTNISGNNAEHQSLFLLSSQDSDNQSLSYFYKYSDSSVLLENTRDIDGINYFYLTLEDMKNLGISSSGVYQLEFFAYDGLEYSNGLAQSFTISFAPIIKTTGFSSEDTYLTDGNDELTVLKYITLNFLLEYDLISNLQPVIRINGSVISNDAITNFQTSPLTKTLQIDVTLLEDIGPGESIESLQLSLKNGDSPESNIIDFSGNWTRPFLPKPLVVTEVINDELGTKRKHQNFFNNGLSINYEEPEAEANQPKIEKINLLISTSTSSSIIASNLAQRSILTSYWDLTKVNRGEKASLTLQVTDVAGQVATTKVGEFFRITQPVFAEEGYAITPNPFNPNNEESFSSSFPLVQNSSITSGYECSYSYRYLIAGVEKTIGGTQQEFESQILFTMDDSSREELKADFNIKNYRGEAIFQIKATDPFGQEAIKNVSFVLNCQTKPFFSASDDSFKILHGYDSSKLNINDAVEVIQGNPNTQLFNPEEFVVFKFPIPEDVNEDLSRIDIFISRNDELLGEGVEPVYEEVPWKSVSIGDIESDGEYYYISHKVSSHYQNKFYYFKIRAVDSTLLFSDFAPFSVYIIGARVTKPIIKISNLNAQVEDAGLKIDFKLDILDLGGSAPASGWNNEYYNSYPNFDRQSPAPELTKKIKIEIAETQDNFTMSQDLVLDTSDLNFSCVFSGYEKNKAYIRISAQIPYAKNGDSHLLTVSAPFVYLHFDSIPTVSYRPNRVGINTKLEKDESYSSAVLVIESYEDYNKIIVRGQTELNQNEIVIDLVSGTVSGLTLSSGSWDEI